VQYVIPGQATFTQFGLPWQFTVQFQFCRPQLSLLSMSKHALLMHMYWCALSLVPAPQHVVPHMVPVAPLHEHTYPLLALFPFC
jgi:hypothetical protein